MGKMSHVRAPVHIEKRINFFSLDWFHYRNIAKVIVFNISFWEMTKPLESEHSFSPYFYSPLADTSTKSDEVTVDVEKLFIRMKLLSEFKSIL